MGSPSGRTMAPSTMRYSRSSGGVLRPARMMIMLAAQWASTTARGAASRKSVVTVTSVSRDDSMVPMRGCLPTEAGGRCGGGARCARCVRCVCGRSFAHKQRFGHLATIG